MNSTPPPLIVEPSNEPERDFRRRIRERSRLVGATLAATIELTEYEESEEERSEDQRVDSDQEDEGSNMADDDRPLNEDGRPGGGGLEPSITRPTVLAPTFEIKSSIINMLQNSVQYDGNDHEDPGRHIAGFLEVCSTFKIQNVSDDAIWLRLFPFSLRDKAKSWLLSLPTGSITTWVQMAEMFVQNYFPPEKTAKLKNRIMTFKQDEGESLHAAWDRYRDLIVNVPHHGLSRRQLVSTFYQGLTYESQGQLDIYAGGDLGTKSPNEAYAIIERAALKSSSRHGGKARTTSRPGVHAIDDYTAVNARIDALSLRFDQSQSVNQAQGLCEQCGISHEPGTCAWSANFAAHEEVDYLGNQNRPQNNPYSNTYNPGWKNHPNFGWKAGSSNQNQNPPGQGSSGNDKLEEMMAQLLSNSKEAHQIAERRHHQHEDRFLANEGEMRGQKASIQNIEKQVGQLAKVLSERPQGGLPGNTEPNPKGHVNAG